MVVQNGCKYILDTLWEKIWNYKERDADIGEADSIVLKYGLVMCV